MNELIEFNEITNCIYTIRGVKVMLDRDLAAFYGVQTKRLKEQVRRNISRFPPDFMFELSKEEFTNWRSQFATSNGDTMGLRHTPMAFTEQGVAMLSSVLRNKKAIEVNIAIMRTFVHVRRILQDNQELARKLRALEKKYDEQFQVVFNAIRNLIEVKSNPRKTIGYTTKRKKNS